MVNFTLHIFNHDEKIPYKIKPTPLHFSLKFKTLTNFISTFFSSCLWDVKMFFLLFFITTPPFSFSAYIYLECSSCHLPLFPTLSDSAHSCLSMKLFFPVGENPLLSW